jgi:beta-galactosidase
MTGENQEPPHPDLRPERRLSLNGEWRIRMFDRPQDVRDTPDGWRTVEVPHTWQTDFLDHPMFRNIPTVPEHWSVSPETADLSSGSAKVTIRREGGETGTRPVFAEITTGKATSTITEDFTATPRPPQGETAVSALEFLDERNGWGPVERDRGNGENAGGGTVQFEVLEDGVSAYRSPTLTGRSAAVPITVDTSGATVLTFRVMDGGDGNAGDHSDWANPVLSCL